MIAAANEAIVRKSARKSDSIAAASRFGRFVPEAEQKTRTASVLEDRALAALIQAFELYAKYSFDRAASDSIRLQVYNSYLTKGHFALNTISGIRYGPADVERFCLALSIYQGIEDFGGHAGIFLNALVELGKGGPYALPLGFPENRFNHIGYCNKRDFRISGDAGFLLGSLMTGGIIELDGSVIRAGLGQRGGKIVINGFAGGLIGQSMEGGEIHVNGPYCEPGKVNHGKIFHNGRLIVDK